MSRPDQSFSQERAKISKWAGILAVFLLFIITGEREIYARQAPPPEPENFINGATTPLPARDIAGDIYFERLGMEDGLPDGSIHSIIQDDLGFIWFGTESGLSRYDGYRFVTFRHDPQDQNSLSDNWVNVLFQDSKGYIWVGTQTGGLNRYDPALGLFAIFKHDPNDPKSLSSNCVHDIYEDEKGRLWIGTDGGLDQYFRNAEDFRHYPDPTPPAADPINDNISKIVSDGNGRLWIGTYGNGLRRFNPFTGLFTIYVHNPDDPNSLSNNFITDLAVDKNGGVWIGTESGLNLYHSTVSEIFYRYYHSNENPETLADDKVTKLFLDSSGALWIGTSSGLDLYDRKARIFSHFTHEPRNINSLSYDVVSAIFEDAGKVLWVGTDGAGANKYAKGRDQFTNFQYDEDNPNGLSGNEIQTVIADQRGYIWLGTNGDGLNRLDPSQRLFYKIHHNSQNSNSLSSDEIWSLYMAADGTLWVGTSVGLDKIDLRREIYTHYQHEVGNPKSLSRGRVTAILAADNSTLWIGTDVGLDRLDLETNQFHHFRMDIDDPFSLGGNQISKIYQDRSGVLWIGTLDGGLSRYLPDKDGFYSYRYDPTSVHSLSNNAVLEIYEDSQGMLWVGTAGGGLNMLQPGSDQFAHFQDKDGLPSSVISGILEDKLGNLWISTNFGLSKFNAARTAFSNYWVQDGLPGNQFNPGACAPGGQGELYFGGLSGLTVFEPQSILADPFLPPIVLTRLTQDGAQMELDRAVERTEQITLRWPDNSFEFEYAALSFAQPEKNQITYKLEGYDTDWYQSGPFQSARYTSLPGGNYILMMKAANHDGVWTDTVELLAVKVIPPIWQQSWFLGVAGLISILLFLSIYSLNIRRIQRRSHELEKIVEERTSVLQAYTEELEALYSADARMLRTHTIEQVFQSLIDVSIQILRADCSAVFLSSDQQKVFTPKLSSGYSANALKALTSLLNESILDTQKNQVKIKFDPLIIRCEQYSPEVLPAKQIFQDLGICSALFVPLFVDSALVGIFNASFKKGTLFPEDAIRLFSALSQRASLSIENAQLVQQAKEIAILEERNRLARDLHDSAKQKAFAALAQIGAANNGIARSGTDALSSHLVQAEDLVYDVIQELTFIIQELYPIALREKGLSDALRDYLYDWENQNGVKTSLEIEAALDFGLEKQQAVYRIVQEAFANIARHSQAREARIEIHPCGPWVEIRIMDNGIGFDQDESHNGMGLRSMKERADRYKSSLEIFTQTGKGTQIVMKVPLAEE